MTGKTMATIPHHGLSVLVPVFNWDCSGLMRDLCAQGVRLCHDRHGFLFELLVMDDCSTDRPLQNGNAATAAELENCRYMALDRNVGRAAIRNMLALESVFDTLLFIDCDAAVCSPDFLETYMDAAFPSGDALLPDKVVCGGLKHPDVMPAPGMELRFKYEKKADAQRPARYRSLEPYDRFTTFSFLIGRECFLDIRFDESFSGYGYEDVRFGMELKQRGIPIAHIDNPLVHLGLEDSRKYLDKTRQAVENLYNNRDAIKDSSNLLSVYRRLDSMHLTGLVYATGKCFGNVIVRNLTGKHPSLKLFSFYKLYLLGSLLRGKKC